jgi:hypothetical protein
MGTNLSVEPAASMFRVEMANNIQSVWQENHIWTLTGVLTTMSLTITDENCRL